MPSVTWVWYFWFQRSLPPTLTPAFAKPAAYGDLLTGILAFLAIPALRYRWPLALSLAWLVNIVGTADLLYAFSQGTSRGVGPDLGSAWYIPTFVVPVLYVTHFMIFTMLIRRSKEIHNASPPA